MPDAEMFEINLTIGSTDAGTGAVVTKAVIPKLQLARMTDEMQLRVIKDAIVDCVRETLRGCVERDILPCR